MKTDAKTLEKAASLLKEKEGLENFISILGNSDCTIKAVASSYYNYNEKSYIEESIKINGDTARAIVDYVRDRLAEITVELSKL